MATLDPSALRDHPRPDPSAGPDPGRAWALAGAVAGITVAPPGSS